MKNLLNENIQLLFRDLSFMVVIDVISLPCTIFATKTYA